MGGLLSRIRNSSRNRGNQSLAVRYRPTAASQSTTTKSRSDSSTKSCESASVASACTIERTSVAGTEPGKTSTGLQTANSDPTSVTTSLVSQFDFSLSLSSSVECEVLQLCNERLVTAIKAADPLNLSVKLYAQGLIEEDTRDACLLDHTPQKKACIVISAVERKVKADPSLFHQFTTLLQEEGDDGMKSLSRILEEELQCRSIMEKELSPRYLPPHYTSHQPLSPQPHSSLVLRLYADKLRTIYAQSELPIYSNPACKKWTPSPSKEYIDLSTIDRKGMTTKQVDESKKASLYGHINKITAKGTTNTVKLEKILQAKPGEKLECVLVEGPPGIGKSTLAWQVCNRWGKRELFQQYSTVLLLPLRDQRVQQATSLKNLIVIMDEDLQERVRKEVIQENWDGKDTLIVLEGLDELPSHLLSQPSIFTALLSGEVLSQATILITSRPSATVLLQKHWEQRISRHFEICGFTEENIDKYIRSVLSDSEQYSDFIKYISIHPHIQSMLYVPLHCVIAVTVYLQGYKSRKPPPRTLTGLYTCLTQTILNQYLKDHPQYEGGDSILDTVFDLSIPYPVHNYFKELCTIALELLIGQKLIFSDLPKELHDLGFTDAVPELSLYQQSANYSYNFLHLSVQEFLAAYRISLMSFSEQEELRQLEYCFENVFRFVAGITKFEGLNKVVVRQAIGIHENTIEQSGRLSDSSLELLYECQDVSALNPVCTYSVELIAPSPHLCLALGYCIANSSCGWKLQLIECFDGRQAEIILQELKESVACHTGYSIQCSNCSTDFTHTFFTQHTPEKIIANIETLKIINLDSVLYESPPPPQPCALPSHLPQLVPRMKRLNTLILEHVFDTSLMELISALSNVPSLRNLTLNAVNSEGIALCQWPPTHQLETLTLSHLSSDSIEMVSRAVTTVSLLKMWGSRFTLQSMQTFVSMLQHNQSLTELEIRFCHIDSHSAYCLAEVLHNNTTLRKLDMSENPVGERGALAMATMLEHNTTLEELDLNDRFKASGDDIGDKGVKALIESLAVNQHLKKLTISDEYKRFVESLSIYPDHKERVMF